MFQYGTEPDAGSFTVVHASWRLVVTQFDILPTDANSRSLAPQTHPGRKKRAALGMTALLWRASQTESLRAHGDSRHFPVTSEMIFG